MIFIYLTVYVNKKYNSFRQLEHVIKFCCFRNGYYNIHVYGKVGEEKGGGILGIFYQTNIDCAEIKYNSILLWKVF